MTSPYELVKALSEHSEDTLRDPASSIKALHEVLANVHDVAMPAEDAKAKVNALVNDFDSDGPLADEYRAAKARVAHLFDEWFGK
jgi:hypothetical protein